MAAHWEVVVPKRDYRLRNGIHHLNIRVPYTSKYCNMER